MNETDELVTVVFGTTRHFEAQLCLNNEAKFDFSVLETVAAGILIFVVPVKVF